MAEESSKPRRSPDTDTTYNTLDATQAITPLRPADGPQVASLIVLAGWEIGLEFVLREGETVIGRIPTADISIRLPSVSRQHARITHTKVGDVEVYEIADLDSMNGTKVNGAEQQSAVLKNNDKIELGDVVLKFVLQDVHEAQYHRELRRRIEYDQLTGLLTLPTFKRQAEETIRAAKTDSPLTLAMTDLDGLKRINDTHGHLAGSAVIKAMGEAIRAGLRPVDRAGLYGGDEAIMVYPGTAIEEAAELAEALRERVEVMTVNQGDKTLNVTISQGLAQWPAHGGALEPLIAAADGALYAAKAAGRNCVRVCGE